LIISLAYFAVFLGDKPWKLLCKSLWLHVMTLTFCARNHPLVVHVLPKIHTDPWWLRTCIASSLLSNSNIHMSIIRILWQIWADKVIQPASKYLHGVFLVDYKNYFVRFINIPGVERACSRCSNVEDDIYLFSQGLFSCDFFLNLFRYCSTFICIWQLLSNHRLTRLKRFITSNLTAYAWSIKYRRK